jgi:AGZA family xanthine/uracil permease-like MFS transporter
MHSYQWTFSDTALKLTPAWPFVIGYAAMALLFATAKWTTEPSSEHDATREGNPGGRGARGA